MSNTNATKGRRRAYNSELRDRQAAHTRELLLEAAVTLLAASGTAPTVRAVAEQAKMSAPTAYRYFPTQAALGEALGEHCKRRLGLHGWPATVELAEELAFALFPRFAAEDALVRAQLARAGREPPSPAQKRRHRDLGAAVNRTVPLMPEGDRQKLAGLVEALLSAPTWLTLHDSWGLDGEAAADAVAWALGVLRREVHKEPRTMGKARAARKGKRGEG